jgi:hypothetical protein
MQPNNLGVRVGSLHLYEDDTDQEDVPVQKECMHFLCETGLNRDGWMGGVDIVHLLLSSLS